VRDVTTWDGFIDVAVVVEVPEQPRWLPGTWRDVVRMRVAPVLTFSHAQPVVRGFVSAVRGDPDSANFVSGVRAAMGTVPLDAPPTDDQWTQDFFETAYMARPAPGGQQHVITVYMRSANIENPFSPTFPLREAGRLVFTRFRGKDAAGLLQFDPATSEEEQTLNSFGNWETIPPYAANGKSWPLGRVIRGRVSGYSPDQSFVRLMDSQGWQSPALDIDTSWLLVAHIDETVSFLKASTPRGWVLLVNDARLAKTMLEAEVARGNGDVPMFVGKRWIDDRGREYSAQATISQVLANTQVMAASNEAAVKVDEQLAVIQAETGLTEAEIIRVPFLHDVDYGASIAYQPGTVNLFVLDDRTVVVPEPHGPVINGVDIFKAQLEAALAPYQVTVKWVENWDLYHRLGGEVHCGTNALRAVPSQQWWEVAP
jgi:protein-arginine deiminase